MAHGLTEDTIGRSLCVDMYLRGVSTPNVILGDLYSTALIHAHARATVDSAHPVQPSTTQYNAVRH